MNLQRTARDFSALGFFEAQLGGGAYLEVLVHDGELYLACLELKLFRAGFELLAFKLDFQRRPRVCGGRYFGRKFGYCCGVLLACQEHDATFSVNMERERTVCDCRRFGLRFGRWCSLGSGRLACRRARFARHNRPLGRVSRVELERAAFHGSNAVERVKRVLVEALEVFCHRVGNCGNCDGFFASNYSRLFRRIVACRYLYRKLLELVRLNRNACAEPSGRALALDACRRGICSFQI